MITSVLASAATTSYDVVCHNALSFIVILLVTVPLVHIVPWVIDSHKLRRYPGPFLAQFTDLWLGKVSTMGHRSEIIYGLHQKYGPIVRIAPNHVSIASPEALQTIYGHGSRALKSDFYDAFVSIGRDALTTRDRAEHARKRKIISHTFSQKSVLEFEPHVRLYVGQLLDRWDALYDSAVKGLSGDDGEGGWFGRDGRLWLDCLPWANYLAFDIIGDLAFGAPFGMVLAGQDSAPILKNQEEAFRSFGSDKEVETLHIPAVKILNGRGEYAMSMGTFPPRWRPWLKCLPWFNKGKRDVEALTGIAILAVAKRLATSTDRTDLLSKLQAGKDEDGNPMSRQELTAEVLALLIAGSDTISNSTCAVIYYLARTPYTQAKLQAELDEKLGVADQRVVSDGELKDMPYLDACINEALRLHSTSSLGLPRVVPEQGLHILDHDFVPGTVLGVPTFSIHRDASVWGGDVEVYRPERWFERDQADIQRTFNAFSTGPRRGCRACVGRNLATLELRIIISSVLRRFHFVLEDPNMILKTSEGFLRKPLGCRVGIKRRDVV
ncbi:cytochrome P450 monooxygenase [Fistulina hepatica ATCC 64428]|uniref:Cytochrome P450 monooxygenase n=1 Tax=Fistulina hepatica ATCC 64428 TaxID=1128425 RepID=A0A0D7AE07_9AGAR|nr:cytochrome P450 monooxygenase [Fistulina hepatica ATCC 64428]